MNDSRTIYISHSDDMSQNNMLVPSSADSSALSKKVAQNRAAQRAFRERKQNYIEDLENKAKQLDECKRAMIQLQADNDYLRKSVTRLEGQLKQYNVATDSTLSLTKPFLPPAPSLHPLLPCPSSSISPPPSSSLSLTNTHILPSSSSSFSASPPPSSSSSTLSSSSPPPALATHPSSSISSVHGKPSSLSKREKKRQRLLAEEKIHKNDDLEPIQLHDPLAPSYPYQQSPQTMTHNSKEASTFIPSSPVPSVVPNPIRFLQLLPTTLDDTKDQYIHFVEDNIPSSQ